VSLKRHGCAVVLWLVLATPAAAAPTTVAERDVPGDGTAQATVGLGGLTTVRVSGNISESFEVCDGFGQNCKGSRTVVEDALYCYDHSGYSPPDSPEGCSTSSPGPGLTNWLQFDVGDGHKYSLAELGGRSPDPFSSDHVYSVSFQASGNTNVTVSGSPGLSDTSSSGQIHVEFIQDRAEPSGLDPFAFAGHCGSNFRQAVAARALIDPIRCWFFDNPHFGSDLVLPAPAIGSPVITRSPTIPSGTRTVIADAGLRGAARGPIAAVIPDDDFDGYDEDAERAKQEAANALFGDILTCMVITAGGVKPIAFPKKNQTAPLTGRQALVLGLFIACSKAVDPTAKLFDSRAVTVGAETAAGGCRMRILAVARRGRHPSARRRARAVRLASAALKGSCASDSDGDLTLALTARRRRTTIRGLLGKRLSMGFVRSRAPTGTDGPNPSLVLNWHRVGG
jgi:hypothetical protein